MDYKRITMAAVVAWVVDLAYGFVVWGMMMSKDFEQYPAVFRPQSEVNAKLPFMLGAGLIGIWLLSYIYARGYENKGGVMEGLRFGVIVALLLACWVSVGIWATFQVPGSLAFKASVWSFVETVLIAAVIGAVYRPASKPTAVHAGAM